jgi:hypothetical protein
MQSPLKISIIVLAVAALSTGAYFSIQKKADGQSEPLLQSAVTNNAMGIPDGNTTTDQQIQEALVNINNLDQIKLNTDIFQSPEFLALNDISMDLPAPRDIGRPNPFAPIGVDIGSIATDEGQAGVGTTTDQNFATPLSIVKTKEAQNVGRRSATLNGEVGVFTQTTRWFEYGTNQNTVNKTNKQIGTDEVFTATISNLLPNTTYFVKAAVDDGGVTTYGELVSFKTVQ